MRYFSVNDVYEPVRVARNPLIMGYQDNRCLALGIDLFEEALLKALKKI